jgi:putative FmdB family regulatory protein
MPIYAYRCTDCGFEKDYLQRMADPVLTECPACRKATLAKQLTAAGFQLKGSGWYATDFKGGNKPAEHRPAEASSAETKPADGTPAPPAKPTGDASAKEAAGTKADASGVCSTCT